MIDVKNLMLGDVVADTEGKITVVCGIKHGMLTLSSGKTCKPADVCGVVITNEKLKSNGFLEEREATYILRDEYTGDVLIKLHRIANAFVMTTSGMTMAFHYVHELQHLFKGFGMTRSFK